MDNEEILEQEPVAEESSVVEPLIIETKGKFQPFEAMTGQTLEVGKTYNIKVQGKCEFMISKDRPTFGIQTDEFPYTKQEDTRLWIRTGN
jgi:hypothetical protein